MPIYEYRCKCCTEVFEALRPVGDSGRDLTCPACGAESPEKQPSVFATAGGCASGSSGFG